jgi:DNA-binding FadR family transcriptional regulator
VPLATTRRTGLVDQVIEQLRTAVTQGEWPIGERIPTEAELGGQLGVGRNTIREAVRALAHTGIFEVRQGDGTYVRATSEVSGAIRRLCGSELREVLQVRRTLEVEGARLAATERTDEDVAELRALLARREAEVRDGRWQDFARTDAEFHCTVVRSGHNGLLTELYRGLTEVVTASVAATSGLVPGAGHVPGIGHEGLADAIADRDADRAAAEVCGFLDELLDRIEGT